MKIATYLVKYDSGMSRKILIASDTTLEFHDTLGRLTPDGDGIANIHELDTLHPGSAIVLTEYPDPRPADTTVYDRPETSGHVGPRSLREEARAALCLQVAALLTSYGFPTTYEYPGFLEIVTKSHRYSAGIENGTWQADQYAANRDERFRPADSIDTGLDPDSDATDIATDLWSLITAKEAQG